MSKFQVILLCVFGVFIVGGLLAFSFLKGNQAKNVNIPNIVIWGTLDQNYVNTYISTVLPQDANGPFTIEYHQFPDASLYGSYIEAIASGHGPDALLLSQDSILKFSSKLLLIPYTSYPATAYNSTFVQESGLYLRSQGLAAIPFAIDPLVMYWNKDIFSNANLSSPPQTWDQFVNLAPILTQKDGALNIIQGAVGLGEYSNITHAKQILSLLMMQAGNPITTQQGDGVQVTLTQGFNYQLSPAESALGFYTQFADPAKLAYSWNRALPDSLSMFLANRLGVYFGFASELSQIRQKNPNLNFGVSLIPQVTSSQLATSPVKLTFGNMYGLAIAKSSANPVEALTVIQFLTNQANLTHWSTVSGLPSVRKDGLMANPASATSATFNTSALWSRAWVDPDSNASNQIFSDMISNITSGRLVEAESVQDANGKLQNLFLQVPR